MRDAVTSLIWDYDVTGRYFDQAAIERLQAYFQSGTDRITAASAINVNAAEIVKSAASQLFDEVPELIRPGGNAYTTRRYSACLRDMDYYLRYASYALVAGDPDVLDKRVLEGLRETYNSLGVPIAPTIQGIDIMRRSVKERAQQAGVENTSVVDMPFQHLIRTLSEEDV